jgi:D-glycerate 3-kinase
MAEDLLKQISTANGTFVVGVSGSQGSGKSTLAVLLVNLLNHLAGLRVVNMSLDDFYLTHAQRQQLASEVHPLLATRGVPGTHDVQLALDTIDALSGEGQVAIPRFDKGVDDRAELDSWPKVAAPVDVVVLEGWCLSIGAQPEDELLQPVNSLEANEDPEGKWRHYVNTAISKDYSSLYDRVDYLVMLRAPSFEKVFEWRQTQEDKLIARLHAAGDVSGASRVMNPDQLQRFIQHYERITRFGLETLPHQADVVFELTNEQTIAGKR